ncbi:MAG: hypothetical protein GX621_12365 [Pirellulaceae bacterium]|nr:hypothetical protein [Pirellulaceae bacterium]
MSENPCVLVVDGSEETHEVLETALARRGVQTYYARRFRDGVELAEQLHPDLIVLDLELDQANPEAMHAPQTPKNETPLVLLGTIRQAGGAAPWREFVRKPYDYGPLVRKIEELLVDAAGPGAPGV